MKDNSRKVDLSESVYLDLNTHKICFTFEGKTKEERMTPKMYEVLKRIIQSKEMQNNKVYLTEKLYIDFTDHTICCVDNDTITSVNLKPKMYSVLVYLYQNYGVRSKEAIMDNAWEFSESMGGEAQVRAVIKQIRDAIRKVAPSIDPLSVLETCYGGGYRLKTLHQHEEYTPEQILALYIKALKKDYQRRYDESFAIYSKLAEQNHAPSVNSVGIAYAKGQGVKKDEEKGFRYYSRAADIGFSSAQLNVGDCYMEGRGVARDPQKAVTYYLFAARNPEDPDEDAMFRLYECYRDGIGTEQNTTEAEYWRRLAVDHGRFEHLDFYENAHESDT